MKESRPSFIVGESWIGGTARSWQTKGSGGGGGRGGAKRKRKGIIAQVGEYVGTKLGRQPKAKPRARPKTQRPRGR